MSDSEISIVAVNARPFAPVLAARRTALVSTDTRVLWPVQRAGDSARCVVRAIGDRVELHITMTQEVVMIQQCSAPEQAEQVARTWWSALIDRGWVEEPSEITLRQKGDRRLQKIDEARAPHRQHE